MSSNYTLYDSYVALKLHFTTDYYDIVKYKGIIKKTEKKPKIVEYLKFFSTKYDVRDLIDYFIANFVAGDRNGGLYDPEGPNRYLEWKKRTQSLTYNFKQDINTIRDNVDVIEDALNGHGRHPIIMKLYLGNHITLETLVILERIYDFTEMNSLKDDLMWNDFKRLVCKYRPFIKIKESKYENIIRDAFM